MNIHILSDSPNGVSSYANMCRNLAMGLKERGHNITVTGFQTYFRPENYRGITVFPLLNPTHPNDPHIEQFQKNLKKSKAEVLICIDYAFSQWTIFSKQFTPSFIWVPIEGLGVPPIMKETFSTVGAVSQTNFGQTELHQEGVDSIVIYPGWDPEIFKPNPESHCKWSTELHIPTEDLRVLADRGCDRCEGLNEHGMCKHFEQETIIVKHKRKEWAIPISAVNDFRDMFGAEHIIGCVANNIDKRKNIEALIKAFSKTENKKDSLLWIHTAISTSGEPISYLAEQFKVADRTLITQGEYQFSISDKAMNVIYNNLDIYTTSSRAEGFGLAQHEAMAVGVPQIAPKSEPFIEMVGEKNERGLLAEIDKIIPAQNGSGTLWCEVNTDSLTDTIDTLLTDTQMRERMSKNSVEWSEQHTWEHATDRWDKLLQNLGAPIGTQMKTKMEVVA